MPSPTFAGLLALWAEGCCEYTLYRAGEAKDRQCPLSVLKRLETYEHYDQGGLTSDLGRLRTLILRRLDGAESMKTKAEELSNMRDAFPHDEGARAWEACAREILEAFDG
jgi:hypothetical protein